MNAARAPGGCFPTSRDELLLQAALGDGDGALKAYLAWRAVADFDQPDAGTFRLLPLLGKNLKRLGVKDDRAPLFHGIYRKTWAQNQLLLRTLGQALEQLAAAEIPTLALKGAALSILHYRDLGARPMSDGDVLVPPENARAAVETLTASGWQSQATPLDGQRAQRLLARLGVTVRPREAAQCSAVFMRVRHGHSFKKPGRAELDLHWRIDARDATADADAAIWQRAVPIEIAGVRSLAMDATDQLLHVIAHGVRWNVVPPWRWVADVAMILDTSAPRIDWPRLVRDAQLRHVELPLFVGLSYATRLLSLPVPPEVFLQLGALPVSLFDRCDHQLKTRPTGVLAGLFELGYLLRRYREMAGRAEFPEASRGPLHFLQHMLGIDQLWQVGLYSAVEFARRSHATLSRL